MLFSLQKGKKYVVQRVKKRRAIYAEGEIAQGAISKWFPSFRRGNLDLEKSREHSGRPVVVIDDQIIKPLKIIQVTRHCRDIPCNSYESFEAFEIVTI